MSRPRKNYGKAEFRGSFRVGVTKSKGEKIIRRFVERIKADFKVDVEYGVNWTEDGSRLSCSLEIRPWYWIHRNVIKGWWREEGGISGSLILKVGERSLAGDECLPEEGFLFAVGHDSHRLAYNLKTKVFFRRIEKG